MKDDKNNNGNESFAPIPAGEKFCPIMSSSHANVLCTSDCALYRTNKKGRACVFNELQSIAWFLKQYVEARNQEQAEDGMMEEEIKHY